MAEYKKGAIPGVGGRGGRKSTTGERPGREGVACGIAKSLGVPRTLVAGPSFSLPWKRIAGQDEKVGLFMGLSAGRTLGSSITGRGEERGEPNEKKKRARVLGWGGGGHFLGRGPNVSRQRWFGP